MNAQNKRHWKTGNLLLIYEFPFHDVKVYPKCKNDYWPNVLYKNKLILTDTQGRYCSHYSGN
jgi:hypothetical protein